MLVNLVILKDGIGIVFDSTGCPHVKVSTGEMQQVVVNLIMNSLQAMTGQGVLTISSHPCDRNGIAGASIIVADTGTGIPPDKIKTVFDPFYTTKLGDGTGLGLSISQTLIQTAGGLITVRNLSPLGPAFTVLLPV